MSSAAARVSGGDCETNLGARISTLYAHINVATCELLRLIATFDAQQQAAALGFHTTAVWLNYHCGIGLCAAREKVRVAQALTGLPLIQAAFAAGRLSYTKVRALTRVAGPGNEADLLVIARHSTAAQCERILRQYRQGLEHSGDETGETQRPGASLSWQVNSNGDFLLRGRLPAEAGALLQKALQQQMDVATLEGWAIPDNGSGPPLSVAERRAEALLELAERGLASSTVSSSSSSADRYQIHVELNEDSPHLRDGAGLTQAVVERLCCDARIVGHSVGHDKDHRVGDGTQASARDGRKTRVVASATRRALTRRDQGCRFPGCTHQRFVDAHHVKHWAHGGETRLTNLVLLCRRHHVLVHEGGFRVVAEHPAKRRNPV